MLQPCEAAEIEPGLMACLSETRIGLFDLSVSTCTEPLSCVSGSTHRASIDSWCEVASDLVLFTQEDPDTGGDIELRKFAEIAKYRLPDARGIQPARPLNGLDLATPPAFNTSRRSYEYAFNEPTGVTDPSGADGAMTWWHRYHWFHFGGCTYSDRKCQDDIHRRCQCAFPGGGQWLKQSICENRFRDCCYEQFITCMVKFWKVHVPGHFEPCRDPYFPER